MRTIAGLIVLLILAGMAGAGCDRSQSIAQQETDQNKKENRAVQVSVMTVEPGPVKDILVLPGGTEPWQDVCVAADTAGPQGWKAIGRSCGRHPSLHR